MPTPARPGPPLEQDGFTLVEVLVAFTIIALTLTMAMQVLAQGAAIARRGPAQAARIEEAASIMSQFVADPHLAAGDADGAFADGSRWHVRCRDVTAGVIGTAGRVRLVRIALFLGGPGNAPALVTLAPMGGSP